MEQMMSCLNRLKQSPDYQTIFDRKLTIARDCGATDKNVQCWRTMMQCESTAESETDASSVADEVMKNSIRCYQDNPNNPLAGLESLFFGCHHGKGGKGKGGQGPPPPPPGTNGTRGPNGQRPPGGIQGVPQWRRDQGRAGGPEGQRTRDDSSEESRESKEGGFPSDCRPSDQKSLMNCSTQAMQRDPAIMSAAGRLRPEVKKCEDLITSDCEPETKPLKMCLKTAMKPYMEKFKTSFKNCMTTSGFPFQGMPGRPSFL